MPLKSDEQAPAFSLPDETGRSHQLSDYLGKSVLLYFYPKDDTPGCTKEACGFRDDYKDYDRAGIVILGISPDSPKTHAKFKDKYHLPFTLLSDEDHSVSKSYGVWGLKEFMGKSYEGILRTTYLIDKQGKIQAVFENVKPEGHSAQILAAL